MARKKTKSYTELKRLSSFEDRFQYLKLTGKIGEETFGRSRPSNQRFYQSPKWKSVRDQIILRDSGCDLGVRGYEIHSRALVHHINPISESDILNDRDCLYDPDNLITVRFDTHNAIHYGNSDLLEITVKTERSPNDTCPWKK